GLGRALTEALGSGRPVVASAVNGVPDLVRPGEPGLVAEPEDPEAVARCVLWLLDHPLEAKRMGRQGRAAVLELFQPDHMCAVLDETYSRLLGIPSTMRADVDTHRRRARNGDVEVRALNVEHLLPHHDPVEKPTA